MNMPFSLIKTASQPRQGESRLVSAALPSLDSRQMLECGQELACGWRVRGGNETCVLNDLFDGSAACEAANKGLVRTGRRMEALAGP